MTQPPIKKHGHSCIENLRAMLTPAQVSMFIQKAVPELKLGQVSLQESLEGQEWKAAAKQAHKLKSTISLFSANALVDSLNLIESVNQEVIQTPAFKESFLAQCQQLIDDLESHLANG